jgi:hypothetical protein
LLKVVEIWNGDIWNYHRYKVVKGKYVKYFS